VLDTTQIRFIIYIWYEGGQLRPALVKLEKPEKPEKIDRLRASLRR